MATTQELTERVEALERAMEEIHAQYVAPRPPEPAPAAKATKDT